MKKTLFTLLGLLALTSGVNAQLRVLSNGHIQLGDWEAARHTLQTLQSQAETNAVLPPIGGGVGTVFVPDTTTTIAVLGHKQGNCSGGAIDFGGRKDVMIMEEEFTVSTNVPYGTMTLRGMGGIKYGGANGTVFSYTTPRSASTTGTFVFTTNVNATAFLTSSDARYKKNVKSLESMGDMLNDLTPVSYNLDINTGRKAAEVGMTATSSSENDRRTFGFIAQEVREIFPELVYEDENGMLSVDYQGFIPLLVDAYKALDAKVAEQEKMIASLSETARKTKGVASVSDVDAEEAIVLMQNRPNPFRDTTEIRCHLPESVSDAFICIYDLNGRQQMRLPVPDRGDVSVTVSGSSLPAGIYIYALIADGQEADTKRMILTE